MAIVFLRAPGDDMSVVVHAVYELDRSQLEAGDRLRVSFEGGKVMDFRCEHVRWSDGEITLELIVDHDHLNQQLRADFASNLKYAQACLRMIGTVRFGDLLRLGTTTHRSDDRGTLEPAATEVFRLTAQPVLITHEIITPPPVADVLV
jgi:hypothetical protein